MITVRKAPAYATIQDIGRRGFMASGVPRCGAMDMRAHRTLNAMLGNDDNAATLEWALTGGEIEISARTVFAMGGARARVTHNDREVEPYRAVSAAPGDVVVIDAPRNGRFLYIAFCGGIAVPPVMRSRSTYVPGAFGGLEGRRLRSGDTFSIETPSERRRHYVADSLPDELRPAVKRNSIRFVPRGASSVLEGEWTISATSDRMGYRLSGRTVDDGASITSEPVCPGTIQLPPGGEPIVLMADAPTVGGYRIVGAVITPDLGSLAQLLPGENANLAVVTVDQAQKEVQHETLRLERIREWSLG